MGVPIGIVGCKMKKRASSRSRLRKSLLTSFPIPILLCISYDLGINTFDTANVKILHPFFTIQVNVCQVYSNGQSEVVLGKAIKQHDLLRERIVVMTKVGGFASIYNLGCHICAGFSPSNKI